MHVQVFWHVHGGLGQGDAVVEHGASVKDEVRFEGRAVEHERNPVLVIFPHLVVGDGIAGDPQGDGFISFLGGSGVARRAEDRAVDRQAVPKLEEELAALFHVVRCDAKLFFHFADGGLNRGFSGLKSSAGAVDVSGTQPSLLVDQKNGFVLNHEEKRGALLGRPVIPVDCCNG